MSTVAIIFAWLFLFGGAMIGVYLSLRQTEVEARLDELAGLPSKAFTAIVPLISLLIFHFLVE